MALDHGTKHLINANEFRTFMFLGKAQFTLENIETGNYITYEIRSRKIKRGDDPETRFFEVFVAALGDKVHGKVHIGEIDRTRGIINVKEGIKSDYIGLVTMKWLLNKWRRLEEFTGKTLNIFHHNYCSKCGLELTVPESIQDGIGPICVVTKMKQSLKTLENLGLTFQEGADYLLPMNYDLDISFAIRKFPHYLDKLYIPARLRKEDEFIANLYELDKYVLY